MAVVEVWTPAARSPSTAPATTRPARIDRTPDAVGGGHGGSRARPRGARRARSCRTATAMDRARATPWRPPSTPCRRRLDADGRPAAIPTPAVPVRPAAPAHVGRRRPTGLFVKGAPDARAPALCATDEPTARRRRWTRWRRGACGCSPSPRAGLRRDAGHDRPPTTAEHDLELLGLLGLEDPPRARRRRRDRRVAGQAGIRVAMVTGDHPAHRAAIAARSASGREEPGARGRGPPGRTTPCSAPSLDHDGVVLAGSTPEDKLRIARALQARGHVVAMTGDGVNDGPALPGRRHRHRHGPLAAPTSPARPPTSSCSTTTSPPSSPPSSRAGPRSPTSAGSSPTTSPTTWPSSPRSWCGRCPAAASRSPSACCRSSPSTSAPTSSRPSRSAPSRRARTPWTARPTGGAARPAPAAPGLRRARAHRGPGRDDRLLRRLLAWPAGAPARASRRHALLRRPAPRSPPWSIGQAANAFACRSDRDRSAGLGRGTNRLLPVASAGDPGPAFLFSDRSPTCWNRPLPDPGLPSCSPRPRRCSRPTPSGSGCTGAVRILGTPPPGSRGRP